MWSYPYENEYNIYSNSGYNLIGVQQNVGSGYYMGNVSENELNAFGVEEVTTQDTQESTPNYINESFHENNSDQNIYKEFNENLKEHNNYDFKNEILIKDNLRYKSDPNDNFSQLDETIKYDTRSELSHDYFNKSLYENPSNKGFNQLNEKHTNDPKQLDDEINNLKQSQPIISEGSKEQILNNHIGNNNYNYTSYSGGPLEGWNTYNVENVNFNQMNTTYFWDPNVMNNGYFNGYNGMGPMGYDDLSYSPNNNTSIEQYNMTQDPYSMNYIKNVPQTVDLSNGFGMPYGSVFSPNEAFMNTSMKYSNKMCPNLVGVDQNNFAFNPNVENQYNYYNKPKKMKQAYSKMNLTNGQIDMNPNGYKSESEFNLKSIDEDTLEGIIYNGNIKKLDMASIDFINMSDRIWQALRGAGLFKLGNKGRAILKSKISKHLKMYPELRMRTSYISGVRRATTRQLFQLAQICQITSHLR